MVQAVSIDAPQAGIIAAVRQVATNINVPQGATLAVYNVPAANINATYADEHVIYSRIAQSMPVTQAMVMVVGKGKIDNPKLISWVYTLDGHDNFVLKLGTDGKTLVFDISTGQWAWWSNQETQRWRASVGMNWRSSGNIPQQYGSNVIVGDDSYGILWVLDPEKGLDDTLLSDEQVTFPRVATGQMITKGREFLSVFSVDLTASRGQPVLTDNTATLDYSDDQGNTYVTADPAYVVEAGNYDQQFDWMSLGLVRAPGRIFRVSDNGSFARIDGLDVNV